MKKVLIAFLLILGFVLVLQARARTLTPEEIEAVNVYLENDSSLDPNWVKIVENSKDFKHTDKRTAALLQEMSDFRTQVIAGEISCKRRVDGVYIIDTATMADVEHITCLDRWWNSDVTYLKEILLKERSRLDGSYNHGYGGDPNE